MPPQNQPESARNAVKIFVETVNLSIINGLMHLNFVSGNQSWVFLFPADMAKKIGKAMTQQVEEVEGKTGMKFDDRLPNEPLPSPWSSDAPGNEQGGPQK